jgi:hypothetical protein
MAVSLKQTRRAHKGSRDYWERPEEENTPDSKASRQPREGKSKVDRSGERGFAKEGMS